MRPGMRAMHMTKRHRALGYGIAAAVVTALLATLAACNLSNGTNPDTTVSPGCVNVGHCDSSSEVLNPPDQLMGERLFKDTRFGHYFATESNGNVNAPLAVGESVVQDVVNDGTPATLPGPMAGQAVNCLQCHLVQQEIGV